MGLIPSNLMLKFYAYPKTWVGISTVLVAGGAYGWVRSQREIMWRGRTIKEYPNLRNISGLAIGLGIASFCSIGMTYYHLKQNPPITQWRGIRA